MSWATENEFWTTKKLNSTNVTMMTSIGMIMATEMNMSMGIRLWQTSRGAWPPRLSPRSAAPPSAAVAQPATLPRSLTAVGSAEEPRGSAAPAQANAEPYHTDTHKNI